MDCFLVHSIFSQVQGHLARLEHQCGILVFCRAFFIDLVNTIVINIAFVPLCITRRITINGRALVVQFKEFTISKLSLLRDIAAFNLHLHQKFFLSTIGMSPTCVSCGNAATSVTLAKAKVKRFTSAVKPWIRSLTGRF